MSVVPPPKTSSTICPSIEILNNFAPAPLGLADSTQQRKPFAEWGFEVLYHLPSLFITYEPAGITLAVWLTYVPRNLSELLSKAEVLYGYSMVDFDGAVYNVTPGTMKYVPLNFISRFFSWGRYTPTENSFSAFASSFIGLMR